MSTTGLSPVAAFVLRSLRDHPERRLPEAIAAEATAAAGDWKEPPDAQAIEDGLAELESRGLAEKDPENAWRLTDDAAQALGVPAQESPSVNAAAPERLRGLGFLRGA
jgi:hypothetical protein